MQDSALRDLEFTLTLSSVGVYFPSALLDGDLYSGAASLQANRFFIETATQGRPSHALSP